MTSDINNLLGQVQEVIDQAVAESSRMGEIIDEMKRCGFELCLVVESTVSISPSDDRQRDVVPEPRLASNGEIKLTSQDLAFLESLKISH